MRDNPIRFAVLMLSVLTCLSLAVVAKDKREWRAGTLVAITDSSSNRVIGNSPGSTVTVTDVEYRISVRVDGMLYVGSYWPRWKWSYEPTDFVINDSIDVSINGNEMYIKRPGGKELKTKIIQRIRQDDHVNKTPSPK